LAWLKTLEATLDPSLATPSTAINEGSTDDSSSAYRIPRHFTNEKDKDGWAFYRLMLERYCTYFHSSLLTATRIYSVSLCIRYTNFGRGAALARLRNVERQVMLEEHAAWKSGHSISLTRVMHLPSAIQSDSPVHNILFFYNIVLPLLSRFVVCLSAVRARTFVAAGRVGLSSSTRRRRGASVAARRGAS
jgi:hypothetical protein